MWANPYFLAVAKDLSPFAVAAAVAAIGAGARWLAAHTHNATLDHAITLGQDLMDQIVVDLNQTVVNAAKQSGTWTPETGQAVKLKALARWRAEAATDVERTLRRAVPDLEGLLTAWLESAVATAPNHTPAKRPASDAKPAS